MNKTTELIGSTSTNTQVRTVCAKELRGEAGCRELCDECKGKRDRFSAVSTEAEGWTRVEDGLPEIMREVLVWYTANPCFPHIRTATYLGSGHFSTSGIQHEKSGNVTHWRNLPAPPTVTK